MDLKAKMNKCYEKKQIKRIKIWQNISYLLEEVFAFIMAVADDGVSNDLFMF